jgi:hypothetical protein
VSFPGDEIPPDFSAKIIECEDLSVVVEGGWSFSNNLVPEKIRKPGNKITWTEKGEFKLQKEEVIESGTLSGSRKGERRKSSNPPEICSQKTSEDAYGNFLDGEKICSGNLSLYAVKKGGD